MVFVRVKKGFRKLAISYYKVDLVIKNSLKTRMRTNLSTTLSISPINCRQIFPTTRLKMGENLSPKEFHHHTMLLTI